MQRHSRVLQLFTQGRTRANNQGFTPVAWRFYGTRVLLFTK